MEHKWTKAPWRHDGKIKKVEGDYLFCGSIKSADQNASFGDICRIQSCDHIETGIRIAEAEANINLICTAPELYEALEKILRADTTEEIVAARKFANEIMFRAKGEDE